MSDGECNEGSVWEAAMFAAQHELQNLTAIVDYNKWQAPGRSEEVLKLKPLAEKWRSFGWDVMEVDGHVHQELFDGMTKKHDTTKPRMILLLSFDRSSTFVFPNGVADRIRTLPKLRELPPAQRSKYLVDEQ